VRHVYGVGPCKKRLHLLLARACSKPGNTKGGSITVPLTSCLTGLESAG